jgi:hypothetical protein
MGNQEICRIENIKPELGKELEAGIKNIDFTNKVGHFNVKPVRFLTDIIVGNVD